MLRFNNISAVLCALIVACFFAMGCNKGGGTKECKRACEECLGKEKAGAAARPSQDRRNLGACIETCKERGTTAVFAYCTSNKPTRDQCTHACEHYANVIKARQQRKSGTADDLVFGNTAGDRKRCVRTCVKYGTQEMLRCVYRSQLPSQAQRCMR